MRWLALALVVGGCHPRSRDEMPSNRAGARLDVDAAPVASAWAERCRDALARGRDAAAAIEPSLATVPVELDLRPDREEVSASAFPPVWKVPPLHVTISRPTSQDSAPWQTFARYELGGDHRIARRVTDVVEAAVLLDGWDPPRADAIIAAIEQAIEPCFDP